MRNTTPSAERPETVTIGMSIQKVLWGGLRMMVVWAAIGVVSGLLVAPRPITPISLIAGVIAGVIVFSPVGALLGLFAARRAEVLIAALLGLCLGTVVALCTDRDIAGTANQGLVMGGIAGSTLIPVFFRLSGWIRRLVKQPEQRTADPKIPISVN